MSEHHPTPPDDADQRERFKLFRLCPCDACGATGKVDGRRCQSCRGEGRALELVATCGSAEAVGVALVTLGREGEWADCPGVGLLDTLGEKHQKWILLPFLPSPRNVSDAGKLLRHQRDILSGNPERK